MRLGCHKRPADNNGALTAESMPRPSSSRCLFHGLYRGQSSVGMFAEDPPGRRVAERQLVTVGDKGSVLEAHRHLQRRHRQRRLHHRNMTTASNRGQAGLTYLHQTSV